ncbi:hypothetical protein C7974DRAFT_426554 [Boeremia exigua]|uniref:uncharacterized protein n=1 Tax=Boeremia exigua TaxID=749465 RepID=UPI001E8D4184|nr:uncharacterized protein C7974DRAFT_426554 [Boeremia exigua]KAH6620388.1 hypothetical protein C7974DRAFT_426554 [Boeremia exigua]
MANSKRGFTSLVFLLVLFSLLSFTSAFLTRSLPDGRRIRIPGLKPNAHGNISTSTAVNINIARRGRRPGQKPGSASSVSQGPKVPVTGKMCGLDTPTAESWDANREAICEWYLKQHDDYIMDPNYANVMRFLRDRWAPNLVGSSLLCDGVGACSIGTCRNLVDDNGTNGHDRQMALYVFEQAANAVHLLQATGKQFTDSMNTAMHNSDSVVDEFSSAPRIEKALKDEAKKEKIALAIVQSLGLAISGGFGFAPKMVSASVGLVVNTYISVTTLVNEFRPSDDFVDDLKDDFRMDLGTVLEMTKKSIQMDLHDLWVGAPDHKNRTIVDLMTDSDFLEPDPDFMPELGAHIDRIVLGTAINKLWEFDRAYFNVVENPGGCEADKTTYVRGPFQYLVCLPEHPGLGFWLYSLDRAEENDSWGDDAAQVRGPTGFYKLSGREEYFEITLQGVARSSYWAYKNKLVKMKGDKIDFDPLSVDQQIRRAKVEDRMLGVFTVPVCFNPGGESISGVLDKRGQNYPCLCGNFAWTGGYTEGLDERITFLTSSGFMFSEDTEYWCRSKNKCEVDETVDLRKKLNAARRPGDPPIPDRIQHPFKKCNKRRDSKKHPGWPMNDMTGRT